MIDRYAREALACYGRLRQLSPAHARAELERVEHLLVIADGRADQRRTHGVNSHRPR
jgi:hypothetical protein